MNTSSTIRLAIVLGAGLILSIWLGVSLVTQQFETLLKVGAAVLLLASLFLGRSIWLLMVVMSALDITLIAGVGTQELGFGLFVGFSVMMWLMRRLPLKFSFGELEMWALALALLVLQVYVRNPVGLNFFGASSVGGRPYFIALLVFAVAVILSGYVVDPKKLRLAMYLSFWASLIGIPLQVLRHGGEGWLPEEGQSAEESGRFKALSVPSTSIGKIVSSFISPLRACFHPLWGGLMLLSIALAAGSGFRSSIAYLGMIYLVAIAYWGGLRAMIASMTIGALGLGVMALLNLAAPLPGNIQRALSPLPGTWEERHRRAGEGSTEWRKEMWRMALFEEGWIQNKILGDGLGMTELEMRRLQDLEERKNVGNWSLSGITLQQEAMMLAGAYHSGPVNTVRIVGYVGLVILLAAMIRLSIHAHRQINRCRGTEYFAPALFFMVPVIISPFFFTFVFGEFASALSGFLIGAAWVRLFEKNLPLPAYVVRGRHHHVPLVLRNRVAEIQNARSM